MTKHDKPFVRLASHSDLTQEFLAQMLGVQCTTVTMVAGTLQRAGLIEYKRGTLHIVRKELEAAACDVLRAIGMAQARGEDGSPPVILRTLSLGEIHRVRQYRERGLRLLIQRLVHAGEIRDQIAEIDC